jgi:NAD(P)-dependent dehydrogenase (short-subunit alcohol dehydrogenase family)
MPSLFEAGEAEEGARGRSTNSQGKEQMMNRLDGKVVIVVGAATGTGAGCARRMALEGGDVILADLDSDLTEAAAAKIRDEGGKASAAKVDVRDEESVAELMLRVAEQHGKIDGLHNDPKSYRIAGRDTHIAELDTEVWEDQLQVGLRGYMYTIKHALPHMARGGGGSIVNVSATNAWSARPMNPAYSVAKGGVLSLTACVVASYGKYGIRCNAICPGYVINETTQAKFDDTFREKVLAHTPYTRLGTPDDIGRLAAFLLSEDSNFISGQVIAIDGGYDTPAPLFTEMPKATL